MRKSYKVFGKRTSKSKELKEPNKKYIFIYEGEKTEEIYFTGISNYRKEIGINKLIDLISLSRSYYRRSHSHPKKLLEYIQQHFKLYTNKNVDIDSFVCLIADFYFNKDIIDINLINIVHEKIKSFLIDTYQIKETFNMKDIEDIYDNLINTIISIIEENFDPKTKVEIIDIKNYIKEQEITYDEEIDQICLIFDRDEKNFSDRQYEEILNLSEINNYRLFVTNPCFEFWLLLHTEKILNYSKNELKKNKKTGKTRFLEKELKKHFNNYNKNNYDFIIYKDKIQTAIKNEKSFCENIKELKTELGSNIGLLIEELKN